MEETPIVMGTRKIVYEADLETAKPFAQSIISNNTISISSAKSDYINLGFDGESDRQNEMKNLKHKNSQLLYMNLKLTRDNEKLQKELL